MSPVYKGQQSNSLSLELYGVLFQDYAVRYGRPAAFCVPTQRMVIISYRRLGTTYVGMELPVYGA
jgi:hypothetical protein